MGARVRYDRKCDTCQKQEVYCKGMCLACYQKVQRNTEKGKERTKTYNSAYRERHNINIIPKPPKVNCECGKPATLKNMCRTCYQRSYQKTYQQKVNCECGKPAISKNMCRTCYQRTRQQKKIKVEKAVNKNKPDVIFIFNSVLTEIKKGYTIQQACYNTNTCTTTLYRIINPIQKAQLNAYKILKDDFDIDED
jgi:hypothetical protein